MFLTKKDIKIKALEKSVSKLQSENINLKSKLSTYDENYLESQVKSLNKSCETYESLIKELKEYKKQYRDMIKEFELYKKDTEKQLKKLLNNSIK